MSEIAGSSGTQSLDYDAVIVGGSLAGCTAGDPPRAARACASRIVEKQPDPKAFKRMCTHFIQASAVPTVERLEMLEPIEAAGGVRPHFQAWTRWGWIKPPRERAQLSLNIRREVLDPMLREAAAATPGRRRAPRPGGPRADLGRRARSPASARATPSGEELDAARPAGDRRRRPRLRHRRALRRQGKGPPPRALRLRRLLRRGAAGLRPRRLDLDDGPELGGRLPDRQRPHLLRGDGDQGPPAGVQTRRRRGADLLHLRRPRARRRSARRGWSRTVLGKIEMPNRVRVPVAPGLALVGDAAQAVDPLFGIGCGWAFQSGEWLADSVAPALHGEEPLERGLKRYRRLHKRKLGGHTVARQRLRDRAADEPRREDALRRRGARPEGRDQLRRLRDAPDRPDADVRDDGPAGGDGQRAALAARRATARRLPAESRAPARPRRSASPSRRRSAGRGRAGRRRGR